MIVGWNKILIKYRKSSLKGQTAIVNLQLTEYFFIRFVAFEILDLLITVKYLLSNFCLAFSTAVLCLNLDFLSLMRNIMYTHLAIYIQFVYKIHVIGFILILNLFILINKYMPRLHHINIDYIEWINVICWINLNMFRSCFYFSSIWIGYEISFFKVQRTDHA